MKNGKRMIIAQILFLSILSISTAVYSMTSWEGGTQKDTVDQKRNGFIYFPVVFHSPETKMAGGAAVSYYYRESGSDITSRPSNITPMLIYTQKKQIVSQLGADLYWKDETYHLNGNLGYTKFPDKFYGIGNNTSKDDEEDYTPRIATLFMTFQKKVRPGLNLGIQYEFGHSKLMDVEENGLIATGDVLGSEGGVASGAGIVANWDTRNNIFYPSLGSFYQFSATRFSEALGSDYDFNRFNLDIRQYFPLSSSQILAIQGYVNIITGKPTFQLLSLFGGERLMRGYYLGRYRDKNMAACQMEYRSPVWRRFGVVGFAGIGEVANKISRFERKNFKYSVGWGIRYLFSREEKINLRLDFGYGKGTSGVYINIGEAF